MGIRLQHSNQPWRKTLHTLVCVCVILSNLLSLLALTPQVVQAAAAPITPELAQSAPGQANAAQNPERAAQPVLNFRPQPVEKMNAAAVAAPLAQAVTGSNVLTITKTVVGAGSGPFNITVNGPGGYTNHTTITPGTPVVLTSLPSGVYTVTETSPGAGWTTVYTATASAGSATGGSSNAVVALQNSNTATLATTPITGKVFVDFNSNGVMDTTGIAPNLAIDTGVSGVTVTAYDKNGNSVGSATSATDGTYTINPTGAGPYRVEFSNLPSGYEPTKHGSANGTSTQFINSAAQASGMNFGINKPCDYCQANPTLIVPRLFPGSSLDNKKVAVVSQPYTANGDYDSNLIGNKALVSQVGGVWGVAYQRVSKSLFVASYTKRNVDYGPGSGNLTSDGTGTIYRIIPSNASPNGVPFVDLDDLFGATTTGVNPHTDFDPDNGDSDFDKGAFAAVGKVALGDIDISEDDTTLWLINLADRKLYKLPIGATATPVAPIAAQVSRYQTPDPGCVNGVARPFGLKAHNGLIYVGGVCTAENNGAASDLLAYVYSFDPTTAAWSPAPVLQFPLNYTRQCTDTDNSFSLTCINANGNTTTGAPATWHPWTDVLANTTFPQSTLDEGTYAEPMLSDIEFVGNDMVVGLRDRFADQIGNNDPGLNENHTPTYRAVSAGDILRASPNGSSGWNIEQNGKSNPIGRFTSNNGVGNQQGPGGGEFYSSEQFRPFHTETAMGGLAQIPGFAEIVTTAFDPARTVFLAGTLQMNNQTGDLVRGFELNDNDATPFAKANAIGDVEALCDPAPLEIGNRVWNDLNGNGIQDPGEPGLPSVTVSRQGPTNTVTTATDANGNYYFNINRSTAYTLTVTPPSGYSLTAANASGVSSNNAISDTRDSDAVVVGGSATIYYTTGSAGQNNHGLDFGFTQPVMGAVAITNQAPAPLSNPGAFVVSKQIATTDGSNPTVNSSFNIVVDCAGASGYPITRALLVGTPLTYSNLAAGTVCTINEDTANLPSAPSGYTWVNAQVSPTAVTIQSNITATVTARNTLAPQPVLPTGVLTVTKTLVGAGSGPFNITVNGPSGYVNNTTITPGTPTVITGLANGVYTVTEPSPGAGWVTTYTVNSLSNNTSGVVDLSNANTATLATTPIAGTVFRDFNSDGLITANGTVTDTGVSGVTVTAYDKNGTAVGSATSAADGTYTINSTGAGPYRVEFSNLPSGYEPTAHDTGNGTSTQFVTTAAGASGVNLGINKPAEYCQDNPSLCTSTYVNGAITGVAPTQALIKFHYDDVGNSPLPTQVAAKSQTGSTWGIAYDRTSKTVYSGAFVKRHVGIGPNGDGAIYATDSNGNTTLFVDMAALGANLGAAVPSDAARGLSDPNIPSNDPAVYGLIGKVGLGDIDISADDKLLYVISLNDKKLYVVNVPAGTLAGSYAIPDPGCVGGAWRPFGLKVQDGAVYLGGICDAQTSGLASDLKATVYRFDPQGATFTSVLSFPLNYPRQYAMSQCPGVTGWLAWSDTFPAACNFAGGDPLYINPQPILADIEFDLDGSMILGFMDRFGHQASQFNLPLVGSTRLQIATGGDILRAGYANGAYTLETNGSAGGITTAGTNTNSGPGGGEYYDGDAFSIYHLETSDGGLALLPGSGEVAMTSMDPVDTSDPTQAGSGGVRYLDNSTGGFKKGYFVFTYDPANPGLYGGKGNGLGDVELLCDSAPIEIGNRAWDDLNANGIQDPGEPGINGLTVSLQGPTSTVTTATSGDGNYYFNVSRTTAYTITITPPSGYSVTAANAVALTGAGATSNHAISDTIDSDAVLMGGKAAIYYTTGTGGQNNHGLDFGFTQPVNGQADIVNQAPVKIGNRLWIESDHDGDATTGSITPVIGQIVTATSSIGIVYTATTDSNGLYTITVPANDTYTVTTGTPVGTIPSTIITTVANDSNAAANDDKNHAITGTTVTVVTTDNFSVDFGFHPTPVSLGNLVWFDTNNNGQVDTGEYGVSSIKVDLYQDTNGDGSYTPGVDAFIKTTNTSASGYYSFTNLTPSSSLSTRYLVVIASTNFVNGGALYQYQNSTGSVGNSNTINSQDNGVDGTLDAYGLGGYMASHAISLTPGSQPTDDGDTSTNNPLTAAVGVTDNLPNPINTNWTLDFGFYQLTLGNQLWYDKNDNGLYEPLSNGEAGLAGITVTLLSGGTPVLTTTTDANGVYTFTGLISGTYQVQINGPAGLISTHDTVNSSAVDNIDNNDKGPGTPSGIITSQPFLLTPGNQSGAVTVSNPTGATVNPTLDFGLIQLVKLGNRLWIESDNDGDATTENISPVVGQVVTVTSSSGVVYTTTTDSNGLYTMTVPANDIYTVTTGTPAGTVPSTVITNVADDSNAAINNDKNHRSTGTVVSLETTDNLSVDFGFHTPFAQFGDRVWLESDTDGLASTGVITPIASMIITATDSSGVAHTTTTNSAGYYSFTLPVGTYTVTYGSAPANYGVVTPSSVPGGSSETGNGGSYEETANPDQSHINGATVTVADGQANWHIDFAFHNLVQIGNRLWIEDDTDGDATTGMVTPVVGQVVTATNSGGTVYTTTTDANGLYTLTVPANDTYTVTTSIPAGTVWSQYTGTPGDNQSHTPASTPVTVGTINDYTIDFGFHAPLAQFGDRVWIESDTDGNANTGVVTPVAGMTITATDGTHLYTAQTTTAGYYSFTVLAGTYTVTYGTVPASYGMVTPSSTPGGNTETGNAGLYADATNPDKSHQNNTAVTVAAGEANWQIDFAFTPLLVQIGNRLWIESDTDGDATTGTTTPVVGQVVTATSSSGVVYTTTTDANGLYTMTVPADDTYTVTTGTPTGTTPSVFNGTPGDNQSHTPTGTTVTVGTTDNTTLDFGFHTPLAQFGDRVWLEADKDGLANTGTITPVAGMTITATDGTHLYTAQTNTAGYYSFTLPVGTYTVSYGSVPSIYGAVVPSATPGGNTESGNAGLYADSSNPDQSHANNTTVTVTDGQANWHVDFAFHPVLGSIGDTIWGDLDHSGGDQTTQGSEPGLAGVVVTLTQPNGVQITTTTSITGFYLFPNLPLGVYTVTVGTTTLPAGYQPTPTFDANGGNDSKSIVTLTPAVPDRRDQDFSYPPVTYDWGDLPDGNAANSPSYATLSANNGPSHVIVAGLHIGVTEDNELDGQRNSMALGDDTNPTGQPDDEDGVTLPAQFIAGQTALITVTVVNTTSQNATLYSFIDWNGDGDFNDLNEQLTVPANNSGSVVLSVSVPATATTTGQLGARFRLSTDANRKANGPASDGEVEEYLLQATPILSLGNRVWLDNGAGGGLLNDGKQNGSEPGVANVVINLLDANGNPAKDINGNLTAAQTTDANGYYLFTNLAPGDYIVEIAASNFTGVGPLVNLLSSTGNSTNGIAPDEDATPIDQDDNGNDSSVNGSIRSHPVTLGYGQEPTDDSDLGPTASGNALNNNSNLQLDFGFISTLIPKPTMVSVGNYVWVDQNGNGLQEAGERGVPGVKVTLYEAITKQPVVDQQGNPLQDVTDSSGFYLFDNTLLLNGLPPGSYYVQFDLNTLPVGYVVTKPNAGDDAVDSDADATGKTAPTPVLNDGDQDLTLDLGIYQPASIGDYVWLDKDVDGVQDGGESPVPGVQIVLFKADGSPAVDVNGNPVAPQITDVNGKYLFINLPPGDYYVQFTPPANYFISPQDQATDDGADSDVNPTSDKTVVTTLVSGENDLSWDLGLYQGAAIGNYVWHDKDGNGLQEAGEPGLPGVTVTLYDSAGNPVATTQTDVNGYYGFSSLTPGDYSVQFATPVGYLPTQPDQPSDDALDSDAVNGRTAVTTLTNGEYDTSWDAGFMLPASIGKFVWDDGPKETADGIRELDEPGVAGVTVILLDKNDQEVARTITDNDGFFLFSNLAPGDYKLKFITPTGAEFTKQTAGLNDNSDADPTTGETAVTTLSPGQVDLSWGVGIISIPTALDTEPEPNGGNVHLYLPVIRNQAQTAEGRSSFKKPSLTPQPMTMDQTVAQYWRNFVLWVEYLTNTK
ncbi:hypothetical protein BH10CHL1_BH10CHL1_03290 [soil metagenome]